MILKTEFQAINKVSRISKKRFPDEVIVVFKKEDGDYDFCPESEYVGIDECICGRYLNGNIAPT
jgi:hypothetical protein